MLGYNSEYEFVMKHKFINESIQQEQILGSTYPERLLTPEDHKWCSTITRIQIVFILDEQNSCKEI